MLELTLIRFAFLADYTLGRLLVAGGPALWSIERPWILNAAGPGGMPRVSCVPDGRYELRPHSGKFENVYALENPALGVFYQPGEIPAGQLWGRSAILIHAGNRVADVIGCIAIGTALTRSAAGEHLVAHSVEALEALRALLGKSRHALMIRSTVGTAELPPARLGP